MKFFHLSSPYPGTRRRSAACLASYRLRSWRLRPVCNRRTWVLYRYDIGRARKNQEGSLDISALQAIDSRASQQHAPRPAICFGFPTASVKTDWLHGGLCFASDLRHRSEPGLPTDASAVHPTFRLFLLALHASLAEREGCCMQDAQPASWKLAGQRGHCSSARFLSDVEVGILPAQGFELAEVDPEHAEVCMA